MIILNLTLDEFKNKRYITDHLIGIASLIIVDGVTVKDRFNCIDTSNKAKIIMMSR